MARLKLSPKILQTVARRFRYLSEPFRLCILQELSSGEKTVTQLVERLKATQPNVSKHLQLLLDGGIVSRRKQGTSNIYSIADPLMITLCELVCQDARKEKAARSAKPTGRMGPTKRRQV